MASESGFNPIHHVIDAKKFEFFETAGNVVYLPLGITKFQILITLSALLVLVPFVWVARKIATGEPPRGRLWNFLEMMLLFIRDEVVRPSIGEHDYKRFLPFIWTLFFFILVMNLLGMIPFLGSATASLGVTGALAIMCFIVIHYNGVVGNHGFVNYMKTFIPHIDMGEGVVMKIIGVFMMFGLFVLEVFGAFIRASVLAIRLFANMLAGHTALVVVLSFILMAGNAANAGSAQASTFFWPITISSVVMVVLLSFLELFVACLQAFIFTFLTAIFIGLAMHPQH
jgi:F-type H+-transporting ATPase subunit a